MVLKKQSKNKIKLLTDKTHKHNAADNRTGVIKRACFSESLVYCCEQFIKAYVTSLIDKKDKCFFSICISETCSAAEKAAHPMCFTMLTFA